MRLESRLNGNVAQVRRLRDRIQSSGARADREARIGLRRAAEAIRDATAAHAPASFDPHLKVSVDGFGDTLRATVQMDTQAKPHALYLDRGTGIYGPKAREILIRVRFRKALRWFAGGAAVFATFVRIRGIRPLYFMAKGFRDALPQARRLLSARIGNITKGDRRG